MHLMDEQMFFLLYFLNALVLGTGFLLSFGRRRVYSLLWAALAGLHLLAIFNLSAVVSRYNPATLMYGQALMAFANVLFLIMTVGLDTILLRRMTRHATVPGDLRNKRRSLNRYFLLAGLILAAALLIRLRAGTSVIFSDWESARTSFGSLDALSNVLGFIFFPSIWLAIRTRKYLLAMFFALLGLAFFQISGSRAMLLTLVCAVYIDLLVSSAPMIKKIFLLALLGIGGLGLHTFARLVRGLGLAAFLGVVASGNLLNYLSSYGQIDFSGGEGEIYQYYYYVIDRDYDKYPYKSGVTLVRLALLYVPRSIAPGLKPSDITYQIWLDALWDGFFDSTPYVEALREAANSDQPGSLHPTLWGDAYANAGLLGVILYPMLFSLVAMLIEYFVIRLSLLGRFAITPVIGVGYLMVARGSVVNGSGFIGYIVPMIVIMFLLVKLPLFTVHDQLRPAYATSSLPG